MNLAFSKGVVRLRFLILSILFIIAYLTFYRKTTLLASTAATYSISVSSCSDCQDGMASGDCCYYNYNHCGFYWEYFCVFDNADCDKPSCDDECEATVLKVNGQAECTSNGWDCSYEEKTCDWKHRNTVEACGGTDYVCDGSEWKECKKTELVDSESRCPPNVNYCILVSDGCFDGLNNDCDSSIDCSDSFDCSNVPNKECSKVCVNGNVVSDPEPDNYKSVCQCLEKAWISDSSKFESGTTPNCCGDDENEVYDSDSGKCVKPVTCSDSSDCCAKLTDYKGWVVCENGICKKKDSKVSGAVYCCDSWKDCCGKLGSDVVSCSGILRTCGVPSTCSKDHETSNGDPCGECCQNDPDCDKWNKLCVPYKAECIDGGCECRGKCESNSHCAPDYCCTHEINESMTTCVKIGKKVKSSGKSYLCAPS